MRSSTRQDGPAEVQVGSQRLLLWPPTSNLSQSGFWFERICTSVYRLARLAAGSKCFTPDACLLLVAR